MNVISERMKDIPPSGTLKMLAKSKELEQKGRKIIHLEVGQPDFDTPLHIKEAAISALKDGFTKYTSSQGIPQLLTAIAEDTNKDDVSITPKNVIVTPGAKHAILLAMLATLNPGDEVLITTPAWPTYFTSIKIAGGVDVQIPVDAYNKSIVEKLNNGITQKSKMILINSPSNPLGDVMDKEVLNEIYQLAVEHELMILSDEIYQKLVYNSDERAATILAIDKECERTIVINGFSKAYSMTGWRLGYAVASSELVKNMIRIQQNSTTCPTSFVQIAGVAALQGSQMPVKRMVERFNERRMEITRLLNDINGVRCNLPQGAFYVFPDFSELKITSEALALELLEEKGVATAPGTVFGKGGEYHLRLSYANSLEEIRHGATLIKEFVEDEI
ncbi:pyridoxal phosphate-dependent aminotransferase [Candidatus Borrarchaeum sp.]|uniref:pyridoxal phosphate-dependent aminotransferase n=1 Tax=Candidatus Borrarchaeum sp. TaxID=2846742 RepID=UPI00257EA187|nr:pyridoxal phosphate-dependent aminotransferase [Candidatus Borrarchaeum sp.]